MSGVTWQHNAPRGATESKKKTQATSCALCKRTWGNQIKYLKVPSNPVIRQRWEGVCGKQFGASAKICEKHFVLSDFKQTEGGKRRRLKSNSVPSLLLPPLASSIPDNANFQIMDEHVMMVVEEPAQSLLTTEGCCMQADVTNIGAPAPVMVYDDNQNDVKLKWQGTT